MSIIHICRALHSKRKSIKYRHTVESQKQGLCPVKLTVFEDSMESQQEKSTDTLTLDLSPHSIAHNIQKTNLQVQKIK